ncbi:hypothetical protein NXV76_22230 [Parabacteroides distasonis]|uniref:hypothetical protein n=1 Tax=Parabacteroides distasonis TaxID=823 RepID=UPI0021654FBC|nr:hypothetical protein [Parabacteroides distasonis]MCS2858554.1 hypothetical protein [Parabacteroides distasonis]
MALSLVVLVPSAMNNKAVQDTNKANMEIAKYQAQWQQQENEKACQRSPNMWNLQNEYRFSTQQMARHSCRWP